MNFHLVLLAAMFLIMGVALGRAYRRAPLVLDGYHQFNLAMPLDREHHSYRLNQDVLIVGDVDITDEAVVFTCGHYLNATGTLTVNGLLSFGCP